MTALADRTQRKLTFFILSVAFLAMLYLSWMRWGSLYVDTFRDQWVYHNILSGKVVYKDFRYLCGFLPPYLGAFFCRLFGETLYALAAFGMVVAASSALLVYRISRFFLDRFISTLVAFNFIAIFAFGGQAEIFNFILPYSNAMTVAMLFILLTVYFFVKFIFTEKRYHLYFMALFLCLAILSRFELGLPVSLGLAVGGVIYFFTRRDRGLLLFTALAVAAGCLSYLIFLAANGAFQGFYDSVGRLFVSLPKEHYFYSSLAGFLDPIKSVAYVLKHFLVQFFAASLFILTALSTRLQRAARIASIIFLIVLLPLIVILKFPYYGIYSSLPVIDIFGIVYIACRIAQEKGDLKLNLSLLLLFFTALAVSLRVILNFSVFDYGFALGALALIPFYIFWFKFFPDFFPAAFASLRFHRLLFIIFLILINVPLFADNVVYYAKKNVPIKSNRGLIFSLPDERSRCFWQAVDYLNAKALPGDTLAVLPEGVGINYFCNLAAPLYAETFVPSEIVDMGGDDRVIKMLASHKVDYIAITGRDSSDYFYTAFGVDYGKRIDAWIRGNYRLEKVFGGYPFASKRFGIAIYRHRG